MVIWFTLLLRLAEILRTFMQAFGPVHPVAECDELCKDIKAACDAAHEKERVDG